MPSAKLVRKASLGPADVRACAAEIVEVVPAVMRAVRRSMRSDIVEGLSIPQYRCVGHISRNPGGSVSEVAGFLGVTLATASAMIDRLVRAGFVQMETSAVDRRRAALSASPMGKALIERMRGAARRDMAETLAGASDTDLAALIEGVAVMKKLFSRV